jgi:quercetin dioxygenase-like cupin family protein
MTDHPEVVEVDALATDLLDKARGHHSRRTAHTMVTGSAQRVTMIALIEGAELAEHYAPAAATMYVVTGKVRLHTHDKEWTLDAGSFLALPAQRHGLNALSDAAVLLTVALR